MHVTYPRKSSRDSTPCLSAQCARTQAWLNRIFQFGKGSQNFRYSKIGNSFQCWLLFSFLLNRCGEGNKAPWFRICKLFLLERWFEMKRSLALIRERGATVGEEPKGRIPRSRDAKRLLSRSSLRDLPASRPGLSALLVPRNLCRGEERMKSGGPEGRLLDTEALARRQRGQPWHPEAALQLHI